MGVCPNCAREHDDGDIICVYCGYVATMPGKPVPPQTANPAAPPLTLNEQPVAAAVPEPALTPAPKRTTRNLVVGAAALVVLALVALGRRPPFDGAPKSADAAPARAATSGAAAAQRSATSGQTAHQVQGQAALQADVPLESIPVEVPKWKPTRQSRWARDGSPTMGFEVEAERDVAVYQDRVRPILGVRCVARATEVFVLLQSAASIENASDTHTVKIGLDGEPDAEQQWLDSVDKQALFSPDGPALAERLAAARRLRFSFRPFNAAPATVEFDVHGFEQPLATMTKACAPQPRRSWRIRG